MQRIVRPLNYRHAYHAGNFADVFKHATLVELLQALEAKPAPFCYLDTHAGRGLYDLAGEEALATHEADDGIRRLLAAPNLPAPLHDYVELVRSFNESEVTREIRFYPGSPLIASRLLRAGDRALLCELQPDEAEALRARLRRQPNFHVHERDGYEALRALLPPRERRGLVLIDPPFEAQAVEFRLIEDALETALARWPTGRYAVWYPIKLERNIRPFHRWLGQRCPGKTLVAEFLPYPPDSALSLNGCGLALINPPWHFESGLEEILTTLCKHLAQTRPATKSLVLL